MSKPDLERKFLEPQIKKILTSHWEWVKENLSQTPAKSLLARTTDVYDQIINMSFSALSADMGRELCLVGLGSYGRKEVCPRSDLDILILHSGASRRKLEEFSSRLLALLWDQKIQIGHTTQSIEQSIRLAQKEHTFLTALLDARWIAGNAKLFQNLKQKLKPLLLQWKKKYFEQKLKEVEIRAKKFGEVVWQNEPHLMEGVGFLRDWHFSHWLARVCLEEEAIKALEKNQLISRKEKAMLARALGWIFKTRIALHLLTREKTDLLRLELQSDVAKLMGIKPTRTYSDVRDCLFRKILAGAEQIQEVLQKIIYLIEKKFYPGKPEQLFTDFFIHNQKLEFVNKNIKLENLYSALDFCAQRKITISPLLKEKISLLDKKAKESLGKHLIDLLKQGRKASFIFFQLKPLGILKGFCQELEQSFYLGQRDGYHKYTVGWHSIRCLEMLENEEHNPKFALEPDINWKALKLAGLIHDLGKIKKADHTKEGAKLARRLAKRFSLEKSEADLVEFLVREHLLLNQYAQRRDFYQPTAINFLTKKLKNPSQLKMLYLLTVADIKAVSQTSWTAWKEELLKKLYRLLELNLEKKEALSEQIEKKISQLTQMLKNSPEKLSKIEEIEKLPTRYLLGTPAEKILKHLQLMEKRKPAQALVIPELIELPRFEITIICDDRPGLFAQLAGALSALNFNILSAEINTFKEGTALDIFTVEDLILARSKIWQRELEDRLKILKETLKEVIEGRSLAENLLAKKKPVFKPKSRQIIHPKIEFDKECSEEYAVIEIQAPDQPGLLFHITKTIYKQGLDIHFAKISTRAEKVFDIFYLQDPSSQKRPSAEKIFKLIKSLQAELERLSTGSY